MLSCNQSVEAEASPAASGDATGPGSANDTAGEDPSAACSKDAPCQKCVDQHAALSSELLCGLCGDFDVALRAGAHEVAAARHQQ